MTTKDDALKLHLELPWPPSMNSYWRRHGHMIHLSKQGKKFRDDALRMIASQKTCVFEGKLEIAIVLFAPNRRKFDVDNRVKAVFDVLQKAGIVLDDNQFRKLIIEDSEKIVPDGFTEVYIQPYKFNQERNSEPSETS